MPPPRNLSSPQKADETKKNHIEISAAPNLENAFHPNTSLTTTLTMLQSLPDPGVLRVVPKTSSKDQTWMLRPSVVKLLHKFRDAVITRFYPNASKEEAEAETAYIFNQIAPLLQRVPPVDFKKPQDEVEGSFNNQSVQRKFAHIILGMIASFVNESGEEFLKPPHHQSAAHQVDFWKRGAIQQVLDNELNYNKEKGLVAIYDAWERQSQEWANDLESQCRQFIREKEEMEVELKKLTSRCVFLEKMQSKSVEEQVRIQVNSVLQAHAALEKKCKKFALVNKDFNKHAMFLAAKSNELIQERLQSGKVHNELIAEYNTLCRDYNRVIGINKFLYDRLLHAQDIQEGMVNEEYKKELARLKEEMSELTERIQKFDSGDEYVVALEQYAFIHEKYEAEKQAWELEKETWSAMTNKAVVKLKANELLFEKIRSAFANKRAEQEKKVTKDDGIKKEGGSDRETGEKTSKREFSFDPLTDTIFNDDPTTRQVIAELQEEPEPTPKEANLQRIISSLQNELSISRRAWKIESGQQVEFQKKLVAEKRRLAQELATEKEAREELEAEKSTLSIEGANFDGTLIWVSDTYEQAEKKLKEELKEQEEKNEALSGVIQTLRVHSIELEETLAGVVAKAASKSLGDAKDGEGLRNRVMELDEVLCGMAAEIQCKSSGDTNDGEGSQGGTGEKANDENIKVESLSDDRAGSEVKNKEKAGMESRSATESVEENDEKANVEKIIVEAVSEVGEKENAENVGVESMSTTGTVKESGEKGGSEKGRLSMIFGAFRTKVGRHTWSWISMNVDYYKLAKWMMIKQNLKWTHPFYRSIDAFTNDILRVFKLHLQIRRAHFNSFLLQRRIEVVTAHGLRISKQNF